MRNKLQILLIAMMSILSYAIISCSDDPAMPQPAQNKIVSKYDTMDLSCYPMAKVGDALSRSTLEGGYWESWDILTLNSGDRATAPWRDGASSTVNTDILRDIKYSQGWDLIYNTINGSDSGKNYLVFHNRFTGILKVMYYLEESELNNSGIWEISVNRPTSLFAFNNDGYVSLVSEKESKKVEVANFTNCNSKGFPLGWNCFQIELAYDPNQSGTLKISSYCKNITEVSLSGELETSTDGYIYSSKTAEKNGLSKGIAKLSGGAAKGWVEKKVQNKLFGLIPAGTIASAADAIFTYGAGKLIGALTGLFSKSENEIKSLQLTTNGTFTITGETSFVSTSPIKSVDIDLDPNLIGRLGVWGLSSQPTISYYPYATLYDSQSGASNCFIYEINSYRKPDVSVVINPDVLPYIKRYSYSAEIFSTEKTTNVNAFGCSNPTYGSIKSAGKKVYEGLYESNIGSYATVMFRGGEYNEVLNSDEFDVPIEVFIPSVPNGPEGCIPNYTFASNYIATVTVEVVTKNDDIAQSVHKCLPLYQWDYSQFNDGFYKYLYPCVPVDLK